MPKSLHKTAAMLQVEEIKGERLELLIPRLINTVGLTKAADELGISKSSMKAAYMPPLTYPGSQKI